VIPPAVDLPDLGSAPIGGRYELTTLLKRGNGIDTYAGLDLASRSQVIVKSVSTSTVSTAMRMRLEHEARVLEHLDFGRYRRVLWSGQEGEYFFLVQPRLEGRRLSELLEDGALSVDATLRIATCVLETMQIAHEKDLLHRDIKPANILVQGDRLAASAELIDFGFARSSELHASVRDAPVGTVRYIAPEAAGLIKVGVDQRADLYSLGIVLFECLAGYVPFSGNTVGEVLLQHLNVEAPQLRSMGLAVPRCLDGVLQRMLAKDPGERYQSASSVLADLSEIGAELAAGRDEPSVTPGLHDRRHVLAEPSFVGRTHELQTLTSLLNARGAAAGGLVLVEAESGAGKTRLLDELALQAGRLNCWVLRGQGVDQAAQRPFEMLHGIVDAVVDAESDPWLEGGLRAYLGDRAAAAAAALPALAGVLGPVDQVALGPEAYGETRSIDALAMLLDALGQGARPALVILDDCQWADALTIALLARWQSRKDEQRRGGVLIVAAYRSDEVPKGHPLRLLDPSATVPLNPFVPLEIEALCTSMAGPLPAEAASTIVRLAEGSPYMASAILRGMVETGALRDSAEGWEIDPGPMKDVQTSRRAALFLSRRFELMAPEALNLLISGAVLGKVFDLTLAVSLSGQSASEVTSALSDARHRQILWIDELENRCSFTHDKLRETLLGRLQPTEHMSLHRRAAELIEGNDRDRVFELAYHFDAAGEPGRALHYALAAAELARGRHALEVAAAHYRIAERAMSEPRAARDDEISARIAEGLGDVLTLQGDYAEAAGHFELALSLTTEPIGRAVIDGKLGNIAFKRGDQTQARRYLEGALRDLGRWVPRHGWSRLLSTLGQVWVQILHTAAPRLFLARRSTVGAEREFAAIRIYSRLAYVYWFSAGKIPCAWAHLREMNMAERYPPSPELAQAYSEHAPVMTMIPWYARGLAYAKRSLEIRRELGDAWGIGQSLSFLGVVLYASSRYRECIEACRESVRLLERTGDRWEQNTATWHQIFSHYRLGELQTAVELAQELYGTATAIGDTTSAGIALSGWARSAIGQVPENWVATELGRDLDDAHTATEVRLAEAVRLLYAGEPAQAVERLNEACGIIRAAGLRQEYIAPVRPWLATALRMQAEGADTYQPKTREQLLRRAARAARQADRLSRSYRNNRPHALRERALIAGLRGHPARAGRLIARSLAVSEHQGAAYESVLTRKAGAQLALACRRAGADADLALAESDRLNMEPHPLEQARSTLSLADQFEMLLHVGRRIGAASSALAIYQEVHDAAVKLLRGDQCSVIRTSEEFGAAPLSEVAELAPNISKSMMAQAIELQAPVVFSPMDDVDTTDSMIMAELRSVLCAPIVCDGHVVACFNVTHHQVNHLFGDVEIQLAEFIATLAGAALEHVAGSEARFRSLAQNSSDVITIVDQNGIITYQSSSVEQVFGLMPEEMVGQTLASWLHPEDAAALVVFLEPPNLGMSANSLIRTRMRHRDGTWRVGESAVRNLFTDPGVEGLVLNTRDASERVALESELRSRALHDPLTGLANRALFVERVDEAFARHLDRGRSSAVIFLDLDDFKAINDSYGHVVGDRLLEMISGRLEDCVRPDDIVARWGGDEFAVLLEDSDRSTAEVIVQRIIAELERPYQIHSQEILSRASAGVAITHSSDSSADLLIAADLAMYVAKSRGKSRYEVFQAEMRDEAIQRSAVRADLEWVLQRNELAVHYQPIVDIPSGTLMGFEALVRWNHPTRGELQPDQWIGLAEDSGMITDIGTWVLRTACAEAARWQRSLGRALTMSVNVSARQLQSPNLVDDISNALWESRLSAKSLVLEITESAMVVDTESVMGRFDSLKSLGVGLSIDDFGTGYSSLSYLRRFPVDYLKVDGSFVAEVATNSEDLAIVSSIISLGHLLGLKVVAEGVETADQLAKLCDMGCDQAQGFIWRRPEGADSVTEWLMSLQSGAARSMSAVPYREHSHVRLDAMRTQPPVHA